MEAIKFELRGTYSVLNVNSSGIPVKGYDQPT